MTRPSRPQPPDSLTRAEIHAARSRGELYFDVHAIDPVFGVGRRLGRVQAPTRALAEQEAARLFPAERRFVSLSTSGRARKPYDHSQRRTR